MSLTYDAPASGQFATPILLSTEPRKVYPFRQDLAAVIYEEDYAQRPDQFVPLPLDTPHPIHTTAYLIAETNPKPMSSGGLVQFTRSFAIVPGNRTEFATTNFSFPAFKATSAATTESRAGFSETCVAKVLFSYVLTDDPSEGLTILPKFQPKDASDLKCAFVASDTTPTQSDYEAKIAAGEYIQAAQTKVRRWRGNIWELQDLKVKAL
jgi:hypothetical protein